MVFVSVYILKITVTTFFTLKIEDAFIDTSFTYDFLHHYGTRVSYVHKLYGGSTIKEVVTFFPDEGVIHGYSYTSSSDKPCSEFIFSKHM